LGKFKSLFICFAIAMSALPISIGLIIPVTSSTETIWEGETIYKIYASESTVLQGALYSGSVLDTYEKSPTFPVVEPSDAEGVMGMWGLPTEADYTFVIAPEFPISEITQLNLSIAAVATQDGILQPIEWTVYVNDTAGTWQEVLSISSGASVVDWTYHTTSDAEIGNYVSDQDQELQVKIIAGPGQDTFIRFLDLLELSISHPEIKFITNAITSTVLQGSRYSGSVLDTYEKSLTFPVVEAADAEGVMGVWGLPTEVDYTFAIAPEFPISEINELDLSIAAVATQDGIFQPIEWTVQVNDTAGTWQEVLSISSGASVVDWTYHTTSDAEIGNYVSDQDRELQVKIIAGPGQDTFIRFLDWLELSLTIWNVPEPTILPATVDFNPDALNLKSRGKWITAYIELPSEYAVTDIELASLKLVIEGNEFLVDLEAPNAIGDYDADGIPDLMVKFKRAEVITALKMTNYASKMNKGNFVEFKIAGKVAGAVFEGSDWIKVISPGK
jgi:hypothetical protein